MAKRPRITRTAPTRKHRRNRNAPEARKNGAVILVETDERAPSASESDIEADAEGHKPRRVKPNRLRYRSDDLRERSVRNTTPADPKRRKRRIRLDEDEVFTPGEGHSSGAEGKTARQTIDPSLDAECTDQESLAQEAEARDSSASPEQGGRPKAAKQRQRRQAQAFRTARAREAASSQTASELSEKESQRTDGITAEHRSRLKFSDERSGFVHGAGSLAKRTAKAAIRPAVSYARQQLREAEEENSAVQSAAATRLAVHKTARLVRSSQRAVNRHDIRTARTENLRQEHAAQVEHRKKEQILSFRKKRQRASTARRRQSVASPGGFVESASTSFSIPEKAKRAAQTFFAEHKGAIVGVAVAGLVFALAGLALSSAASLVHGGGTTVISTTYVSTDAAIHAAENAYCALEDGLDAQVNSLQITHPGYDEYEYQIDEIEHNPYQLISYLHAKYGGFTYSDAVKAELQRLFRQQYFLSLSESSELRTRMETVTETRAIHDAQTGRTRLVEVEVEREIEYEYRTQYAVLSGRSFDAVARANLNAEQLILYDALNKTYGNRPDLFDTVYSSGGGNSGANYTIQPEALSDAKFANMIREAEKYLGMEYVWGGKSPRTGFDCSGFVCWVLNHCGNGWDVGRKRAKELCRMCAYVSPEDARPGDLIFFEKTYDTDGASHVGIYVGDKMMIHCGNPIKYGRIDTRYFKEHFLCFGRLPFYD